MARIILNGINYAEGATIEALDDFLRFLRGGLACAKAGMPDYEGNLRDRRKSVVLTYLDLRKARVDNRHAALPGIYSKSGIPCRRGAR